VNIYLVNKCFSPRQSTNERSVDKHQHRRRQPQKRRVLRSITGVAVEASDAVAAAAASAADGVVSLSMSITRPMPAGHRPTSRPENTVDAAVCNAVVVVGRPRR